MENTKFCTRCGEKIDALAEICPKCGVRQGLQDSVKKEKKEPWLAALASFLVPGLGQLYTNQSFGKAALIFCTTIELMNIRNIEYLASFDGGFDEIVQRLKLRIDS